MVATDKELALVIGGFLTLQQKPKDSDLLIVCGCYDDRVASHAAMLMYQGLAKTCVVSGKIGRLTGQMYDSTEAAHFFSVITKLGIDAAKVLIEPEARNTAENIRNSIALSGQSDVSDCLVVHLPFATRRTYLTAKRNFPDVNFHVVAPKISFEESCIGPVDEGLLIHLLVGEINRLIEFPKYGYLEPQFIPEDVLQAYQELVKKGYTDSFYRG